MVENVKQDTNNHASFGVEALIEKLREKGVTAGQTEAERIIAEARQKATAIKKQAQQEADEIITEARAETEALKAAGKDALQLAARDAHLKLRELLMNRFSDEVRRLVGQAMEPQPFMEKLILQVAGRARDEAGLDKEDKLAIKLPEHLIQIDDLRKKPEELKEGTLVHFVLSVMASLFRSGITYYPSGDVNNGLKVYLKDGDVEVDLTDEAITAVLLEHLQPRFRALLEGVVK
jgi:V/A-type H+/Na+-transporting ATPase subunit E